MNLQRRLHQGKGVRPGTSTPGEGASPRGTASRRRRPARARLLMGVLVLGTLVLVACGGSRAADTGATVTPDQPPLENTQPAVVEGSQVSFATKLDPGLDFQFSLYQGAEALGASDQRFSDIFLGQPVILNFWAGQCPPCRAEMPDLQKFYDEYGGRVAMLGLDVGPFTRLGTNEQGKNLLRQLGITYRAGTTADATVVRNYQVLGMPSTYFMAADGTMFKKWIGPVTSAKMAEITENMLSQS